MSVGVLNIATIVHVLHFVQKAVINTLMFMLGRCLSNIW